MTTYDNIQWVSGGEIIAMPQSFMEPVPPKKIEKQKES